MARRTCAAWLGRTRNRAGLDLAGAEARERQQASDEAEADAQERCDDQELRWQTLQGGDELDARDGEEQDDEEQQRDAEHHAEGHGRAARAGRGLLRLGRVGVERGKGRAEEERRADGDIAHEEQHRELAWAERLGATGARPGDRRDEPGQRHGEEQPQLGCKVSRGTRLSLG
jgi:hypothetical protein